VCARAFGKVVFPNASRDPSRTRTSSHHPLDGRAERMSRPLERAHVTFLLFGECACLVAAVRDDSGIVHQYIDWPG
jgi:hypothetical protein